MKRGRTALVVWSLCAGLGAAVFPSSSHPGDGKELVVFAAASLTDVFQKVATMFEKRHPGGKVRLSFGGSQELRVQIEQGAKADVFASADAKHMAALFQQDLVRSPRIFARNRPVLVVPAGNPARLASFADLAKAERIVVGVPEVPIGTYVDQVLAAAKQAYGEAFDERVSAHIRSRELNVRQVLAKVVLGEADAGIVYRTDAQSAKDRVRTIHIPDKLNITADYPIALLTAAPQPGLAKAWLALVFSKEGQAALSAAGFGLAPAAPTARSDR